MGNQDGGVAGERVVNTALWLQLHPQEMWHGEAVIEGNASALRALANALLTAADGDASELDDVFASDGEGYSILIRRKERPDDFSDAFYTINVECDNWTAGRCTLARQQQEYLDKRAAASTAGTASLSTDEAKAK